MAGIDKILGTRQQYHELRDWLRENEPCYPWSIAEEDRYKNDTQLLMISNFSVVEDFYLWHLCPIPWVKARLAEQYGPNGPCASAAMTDASKFKFVEAGNTYSVYECLGCRRQIVVDMEDSESSEMENHLIRCSANDAGSAFSGGAES